MAVPDERSFILLRFGLSSVWFHESRDGLCRFRNFTMEMKHRRRKPLRNGPSSLPAVDVCFARNRPAMRVEGRNGFRFVVLCSRRCTRCNVLLAIKAMTAPKNAKTDFESRGMLNATETWRFCRHGEFLLSPSEHDRIEGKPIVKILREVTGGQSPD